MKKQVYTYEKQLELPGNDYGLVWFSLSKYADCLLIFINQTGTPGSLIEGRVNESTKQSQNLDFDCEQLENGGVLFDIRVLFGSTQLQFYELLMRRVMSLIWQDSKREETFKIIMNISLPLLKSKFKEDDYYKVLIEEMRVGLKSVL